MKNEELSKQLVDVKISLSDLTRLCSDVMASSPPPPSGWQLHYLTRLNGGFWALEPARLETATVHDPSAFVNCKGCYALGSACGKCARCRREREVLRPSVFVSVPTHEEALKYYAGDRSYADRMAHHKPLPTYALAVRELDGVVHRHINVVSLSPAISNGVMTFSGVDGERYNYVLDHVTSWISAPEKEEAGK